MDKIDVLIVGAGHAGAQLAIGLRQRGFAGSIALVGAEPDPPYERPPLSKDYLAGDKAFERILVRPAGFWADRAIDLRLGRCIVTIDPGARTAVAADGDALSYDTLVWAAGGTPRRLTCTGGDLRGVHVLRSRSDADHLMAVLPNVARVVVVGAGYVGLEAAAVLTGHGKHVTVVEAQDRVLARVAGPAIGDFYAAEHRARGVDLRLGAAVERIEGRDGAVVGVRLADDALLPADAVIVGIGIAPNVAPLLAAGATAAAGGVLVDACCRTSLSGIFAIGDCAAHANTFAEGATIRLESVQNAHDQAATVARALTGAAEPYAATPWFWSNQYDLKLQTVGLAMGHDRAILRGDPATRSFSVIYTRRGRVVALDCVNAVRDYVQGRRLVEERRIVPPDLLADTALPLRDLAAG